MSKLIYVENDYDGRYGKFWGELGDVIGDRDLYLARPQDFSLVCFTGGEDVSPELYGHENLGSHNSTRRDQVEKEVFDAAYTLKTPMTGICRGSQFLNVMMGGTMVQNLKASHGGSPHMCNAIIGGYDQRTREGLVTFEVTSSHHQMSVLGEGGVLLGSSKESISSKACVYDGDFTDPFNPDLDEKHVRWDDDAHYNLYVTEAFAYPDANIFAVQHHPEWQDIKGDAAHWTLRMIREYCFKELSTPISE